MQKYLDFPQLTQQTLSIEFCGFSLFKKEKSLKTVSSAKQLPKLYISSKNYQQEEKKMTRTPTYTNTAGQTSFNSHLSKFSLAKPKKVMAKHFSLLSRTQLSSICQSKQKNNQEFSELFKLQQPQKSCQQNFHKTNKISFKKKHEKIEDKPINSNILYSKRSNQPNLFSQRNIEQYANLATSLSFTSRSRSDVIWRLPSQRNNQLLQPFSLKIPIQQNGKNKI